LLAPRLSPPYPPFARGGKTAASGLFPPLRRGDTGGCFECLCAVPGSSSTRLKIALRRDVLARRRKTTRSDSLYLADDLVTLGSNLLTQAKYSEAKNPLRESLVIVEGQARFEGLACRAVRGRPVIGSVRDHCSFPVPSGRQSPGSAASSTARGLGRRSESRGPASGRELAAWPAPEPGG